MSKSRVFLLGILVFVLLIPGLVFAQMGSITGQVTEGCTGVSLPGLNVQATGPGGTFGAVTNVSGFYTIPGLQPGTYTVQAGVLSIPNVQVVSGQITQQNLGLPELGGQLCYEVTNINDSGTNSLRQAIEVTNGFSGTDTVKFNISGIGPYTIQPGSTLPTITDPVIIDGATQPGFTGTPIIELDGSSAGTASGLVLGGGSDTSIIRGLVINGFNGSGIKVSSSSNVIQGNYIGTNVAGTDAVPNAFGMELGGINNLVGTNGDGVNDASERNIISGNTTCGIFVIGGLNNRVSGNYIGVDVTGNIALPNQEGIFIQSSTGNIIGTDGSNDAFNANEGNVISGNTDRGIILQGPNTVAGNYIGTNAAGTAAIPNQFGIQVTEMNSIVGTNSDGIADAEERNIISGNISSGIVVRDIGTSGGVIAGNYIGTNFDGTAAIPNGNGIVISDSASVRVGSDANGVNDVAERNIISGNTNNGIEINGSGTSGTTIAGNYIGVDVNGTAALSNSLKGVLIINAPGNTIGGTASGASNLISGNGASGVHLLGVDANLNLVQGNFIGTDVSGAIALANGGGTNPTIERRSGVTVMFGSNNTIGGTASGAGNIISGNIGSGIQITDDASGINVQGNFIGTDVSGTADLGNTSMGVLILNSSNNTIGGTTPGARNIISGNGTVGVQIEGNSGNIVQGNFIGTDATGSGALGNSSHGITIGNGGSNTAIGGTSAGAGNIIAFNGGTGIELRIDSNDGNSILSNSIFSNAQLGIDLKKDGSFGVTPNDLNDTDTGPNNLQNFPVLTSANFNGGTVTLEGTLNSTPSIQFTIQFFANSNCDPSEHGEGETLLGSTTVTTDGAGDASFTKVFSIEISTGRLISATTTDANNNTSEFASCIAPDISVPTGYVFDFFATGLVQPQGLAFDQAGNLIVAATGSGEIFRFDDLGNPSLLADGFSRPIDVAVDGNNILYVTDLDFNGVFTTDLSASLPVSASSFTTLVSGLDGPTHLEFGPNGNLFVSVIRGVIDDRVLQIDVNAPSPTAVDFVNFPDDANHNPQGKAFDNNGDMFFAIQILGEVRKVSALETPPVDGGILPVVLQGLDSPGGVGFRIDGRLFVATRYNVVESRRNTQSWSNFVSGLSGDSFNNLLFDPNGQLFIADRAGGRIIRVTVPKQQILASANNPFHYQINNNGDPNITDGSDFVAIQNAFQTWENISTSEIAFINDGLTTLAKASATDGVNLVTFSDDEFFFPPFVLAVTAKTIQVGATTDTAIIVDADIIFNPIYSNHPKFNFGTDSKNGVFDIESIANHEIGHVIGLIHSGVPDATMYFVLQPDTTARSLTLDDRAWASHLYPQVPDFANEFGSISGNIENGESPGTGVAGALVLAINITTDQSIHSYSDVNGDYFIPVPSGDYKVSIEPLDGDVGGAFLTPAHVSAYLQVVTSNFDFTNEFYNGINESGDPFTDDPQEFTPVPVSSDAININFITNQDLTPPEITKVFPADGAANVPITSEILITFSEPISKGSFISSFSLDTLGTGGDTIAGSILFLDDDKLAVITPSTLDFNTTYSITILAGVTDTRGNTITTAFNSSFTTELPDTSPPTVEQIIPADGTGGVFITTPITVIFSELMNQESVINGFSLNTEAPPNVSGSFTFEQNNKVAVFIPSASLMENTTYFINLASSIEDASGNPFGTDSTSSFTTVTTALPIIVNFGPVDGAIDVTISTPVLVDFSEPMNINSIISNFTLTGPDGPVEGAFEFLLGDSRVVFRPLTDLIFDNQYTININTATDVSVPSQNLALPFSSIFTTAAQPLQPSIISASPPSAFVGAIVVIKGEGFDPNPANNLVTFNDSIAVVTAASLTSITTKVPQNATSGALIVTVNGDQSNAFQFDIVTSTFESNNVVARVDTDSETRDADVTPDGTLAYVTNAGANSVSIIDIASTSVLLPPIPVGDAPLKIVINPLGTRAYVTNFFSNTVSVIDIDPISATRNQVIDTIPVGINPIGIAITPDGGTVYVAEFTSKGLSVIDVEPNSGGFNQVVARVDTDSESRDVEVSPDGTLAFVTGTGGLIIININPAAANFNQVVARVDTDSETRDVDVTPDGTLAIVTTIDGDILLIDVHPDSPGFSNVVARIDTDSESREVDVSPDGTLVYVTNFDTGTVSVFEFVFAPGVNTSGVIANGNVTNPIVTTSIGLKLVDTIPVGDNPEGIVIDAKAQVILIANSGSGDVTIIDISGFDTPEEGIDQATEKIEDLVSNNEINEGQGNSLIKKLENAQKKLDGGNEKAAINQLNAFINQVTDFIAEDVLTPAEGFELIEMINFIIDQINNSSPKGSINNDTFSTKPKDFALHQNYPNPFNPSTTMRFEIPGSAENGVHVEISIYNLLGQLVNRLMAESKLPGRYAVTWNGRYENDQRAASGIYLIVFKAGQFKQVKKMMLLQ